MRSCHERFRAGYESLRPIGELQGRQILGNYAKISVMVLERAYKGAINIHLVLPFGDVWCAPTALETSEIESWGHRTRDAEKKPNDWGVFCPGPLKKKCAN